jgi:hypothetical protein
MAVPPEGGKDEHKRNPPGAATGRFQRWATKLSGFSTIDKGGGKRRLGAVAHENLRLLNDRFDPLQTVRFLHSGRSRSYSITLSSASYGTLFSMSLSVWT